MQPAAMLSRTLVFSVFQSDHDDRERAPAHVLSDDLGEFDSVHVVQSGVAKHKVNTVVSDVVDGIDTFGECPDIMCAKRLYGRSVAFGVDFDVCEDDDVRIRAVCFAVFFLSHVFLLSPFYFSNVSD